MNTQVLHKTIEEQNQVIIAKDSYIQKLQQQLKDTQDKLKDARWEIACQKFDKKWASAAIRQKAVHIIGGFEYGARYMSMELVVITVIMTILLTVAVTRQTLLH